MTTPTKPREAIDVWRDLLAIYPGHEGNPNHEHATPEVWDYSGNPCVSCRLWNEAREIVKAHNESKMANPATPTGQGEAGNTQITNGCRNA